MTMPQNDTKHASEGITALPAEKLLPIIKETLNCGGRFVLTVTGNSMTPTLHHLKDKVELVSVQERPIKKGEIILFQRRSGDCILHRVLRVEEKFLVVNGDAQNWVESVSPGRILGVVSRIKRGDRWVGCDGRRYKAYVTLWRLSMPLRPMIFKIYSFIRSLFKDRAE